MNKHGLPDFITKKNFNEETLELFYLKYNAANKFLAQYAYQIIVSLFDSNKNLSAISLNASKEYDDKEVCYFNLNVNIGLINGNSNLEEKLLQDIYYCCMSMMDNRMLSDINKKGGIVLKKDEFASFKLLAGVLFANDSYVDEYFDVLSKDDGRILATDYITQKNIHTFDSSFIYKELDDLKYLEIQIVVMSIKKLVDDLDLNFLKISAEKDVDGYLNLALSVGLNNSESNKAYEENIKGLLNKIINRRMLGKLFKANPIKIEKYDFGGIKDLVGVLFDDIKSGDDFIIALQRDVLEINIENKGNKLSTKKCKI